MNEDLKTLRRKEDNLGISGLAVLLFSMWDIVRFVMTMIMNPHVLTDLLKNMGVAENEMAAGSIVFGAVSAIILGGAFLIRLFIYLNARAESRGKQKGWLYVIVAALALVFIIADQTITVIDLFKGTTGAETAQLGGMDFSTATGLLNITSAFALIDIILSSATVKSIRKKYNIKDGEVR